MKKTEKTNFTDGAYENAMTGLGHAETDKSKHIKATPYVSANLIQLASMKVLDGIAAFIVDGIPEAALMKDISIVNDSEGKALKLAYQKGLISAVKKASSEMRLTGGALIVTEYEGDTRESMVKKPLRNAKVKGYKVYSAGKVNLNVGDFDGDTPKSYSVVLLDGNEIKVHPSRCTILHGDELPDTLGNVSLQERFFGVSALYPVEQALKELAAVSGAIINMAQETGMLLMRFSNLNMMLSKPDCGVEDIHKIMSLLKLTMNSMRAAFAGKDDGFEILSHNFAGLAEIWTKCMMLVAAKCRIPMSILFGQSATGLAQTNEGDIKTWCQMVEMWRTSKIYVPMCSLIADLTRRNLGTELSEFSFGAVDEMTLKQTLEARKLQAETLKIHYDMGAIAPDEVREGVFKNGHGWEVYVK